MKKKQNINQRIKYFIKNILDSNPPSIAKEIDVSGQTLYNITKADATLKPSWDVINKISIRYDGIKEGEKKLSMEWLIRGKGEIWLENNEYDITGKSTDKAIQILEEERLMYRKLIKENQPKIAKILNIKDEEFK